METTYNKKKRRQILQSGSKYLFFKFQVRCIGAIAARPSTTPWRISTTGRLGSKHLHNTRQTERKIPGLTIFIKCGKQTKKPA